MLAILKYSPVTQPVGRAFFDFGVKCLVVVQSEHKINDEFAKTFSQLMYDELLDGKTINEAFKNAGIQLRARNLNSSSSCCCGHAHKPNCQWYELYKTQGAMIVGFS